VLRLIVFFLLAAVLMTATPVTFGVQTYTQDCVGVTCQVPLFSAFEYQQVYSALPFQATFHAPVIINQVQIFGTFADVSASISIWLSTTSRDVGNLDPNPANNLGADNQLFFASTGPLGLIANGAPFYYDPYAGNLLMSISVSGFTAGGNALVSIVEDQTSGIMSRLAVLPILGAYMDNTGAVTQFDVDATPEPASLVLMGGALALAFVRRWSRRKAGLS
jgi:hypothetical protein